MSRTTRFKNYEQVNNTSWDRKCRKTAGFYTEWDWAYCPNCNTRDGVRSAVAEDDFTGPTWIYLLTGERLRDVYCKNHVIVGQYISREPTKRERYEKWRNAHGESGQHGRSPSRWYRNNRMRENRRINEHELYKFMMNPDYEVMCEANSRNCWWDWD